MIRCALLLLTAMCLCAQPRRIVSTAPSITETLFALGLGDRVVGVTNYCHYPAATAKNVRVLLRRGFGVVDRGSWRRCRSRRAAGAKEAGHGFSPGLGCGGI